MFTGIIQAQGRLHSKQTQPQHATFQIATPFSDLALGESVAVDGVCLTVAALDGTMATFEVSPETLHRTSLAEDRVAFNLERALRASDRLSGHIVQGHVDGVARITRLEKVDGEFWILECELPPSLERYCVEKGSIALDGVSLTINSVQGRWVSIQLIPHTFEHTTFQHRRVGDSLNCEIDVLAKYAEKLLRTHEPPPRLS